MPFPRQHVLPFATPIAERRAAAPRRVSRRSLGRAVGGAAAVVASAVAPLSAVPGAHAQTTGPLAKAASTAPASSTTSVSSTASPFTEPAPVYPPQPPFAYGLQAHLYYQDAPKILDLVRDAGFGWTKQQIRWAALEPVQGQYDWAPLDSIVGYASLMGVRLLLSTVSAPAWSRADGTVDGPPDDPQTFATFLSAMATRYAGRVQAYEIWNEQNFSREWGGSKINAGEYVELLKVAYDAIKAADPTATVISGALTPTGFNDPSVAIDDQVFLSQMYEYKGGLLKSACDAIGAHAGGFNNPPEDTQFVISVLTTTFKGHPSFYFRRLEDLRETMVKYGDADRKMWVTEFGWSTVNGALGYEYGADNTEQDQADYVQRAFQMGRKWGWVDGMFLWNLNFQALVPPTDEKFGFGILNPDMTPRKAYTLLKKMAKK